MSPARRRFSSIIIFTVTILLATAICSALYFFKIQKNEDYQNQLHFRELNEVALSISNGIEQLSRVANVPSDPLVTSMDLLKTLALQRLQKTSDQQPLIALRERRLLLLDSLNSNLYQNIDSTSPLAVLRRQMDSLVAQEQALFDKIDAVNEDMFMQEGRVEDIIDSYLSSVLTQQDKQSTMELVMAHCGAYEEQSYCRYITNIYDALTYEVDWIDNLYTGQQAIPTGKLSKWENSYRNIRQQIQSEQSLLDALSSLVKGGKHLKPRSKHKGDSKLNQLYADITQACGKSQLAICIQLAQNDNQQYTRAIRKNLPVDETISNWLAGFDSEYSHLSALFSQKIILLDEFAAAWKTIAQAINGDDSISDPVLAELAETSNRISIGAKQLNELDQQLILVEDKLTQLERELTVFKNAQTEQQPEKIRQLETDLANVEKQIWQIENQQLQNQSNWQQARTSALDSVRALSGRFSFRYTNSTSLLEQLPLKLEQVEQQHLAVMDEFNQVYLDDLLQSEMQHRARLATGGEALRNLSLSFVGKSASNAAVTGASKTTVMRISERSISAQSGTNLFRAPLADLIPSQLLLFPYVLLADESGKILARKEVLQNAVDAADLEFQSVDNLFFGLAKNQLAGKLNEDEADSNEQTNSTTGRPQYSGMLEREIGGILYRVYIQPVSVKTKVEPAKQIYLLGLVPLNKLRFDKLKVSPTTAMWFVLGLVGLTALIPLLKLRFVSLRYTFNRADISQISLGLLILLGVLCIGISDQFFFSYYKHSKVQQSKSIYADIQQDFSMELEAVKQQRQLLKNNKNQLDDCLHRINRSNNNRRQQRGKDYVQITNCYHPGLLFGPVDSADSQRRHKYVAEGGFWLDHSGHFAMSPDSSTADNVGHLTEMYWLNKQLHIANDIALAHRDYFKNAINCKLWASSPLTCNTGFTIQRINNVRDARKNSQFAFAEYDSIFATQMSERQISSLGIRMRTFFSRVLPQDFGYLVFSPDGQVLYHHDDTRSLLENVYIETNDNPQLRTIVNHQEGEQSPIEFETLYRNSEHLFVAGKLHPDLPWYLIVYQSQTPVLVGNMLLVFISICLFIALLAPLFLWIRYGTDQFCWRRLLLFDPNNSRMYTRFAWWAAAAAVFCLFSMGVVHELIIRLIMWLLICLTLLFLMLKQIVVKPTVHSKFSHPALPASIAVLVLLIIALPNADQFSWGGDSNDIGAIMIGLAAAIGMIWKGKTAPTRDHRQQLDSQRYNPSYCWYLVSLCWLTAAIPSMLIVNSANKYLLYHQAHIHSEHLQQAQADYAVDVDRYLELMSVDPQSYVYQDWLTETALKTMYPAADASEYTFPWVLLNAVDRPALNYNTDSPDLLIEALVRQSDIGGSIDADLHYLAKQGDAESKQNSVDRIYYDADRFLLSAAIWQSWLILLMLCLLLLVNYKLIRLFIIQRLLGEHVPDNFRQYEANKTAEKIDWFKQYFERTQSLRVQLIRSTSERASYLVSHIIKQNLYAGSAICIQDCLAQKDGGFELHRDLIQTLQQDKRTTLTLLLSGLDDLAFDKQKRQSALLLLRQLSHIRRLHIILLCEVAPLFRLVKQDAYPGVAKEELAGPDEILAWSNLLADYDKQYDWSPQPKHNLATNADLLQLLDYETQCWPQIEPIRQQFEQYHLKVKCTDADVDISIHSLSSHWTQDQIIEFFASHAGAIYRSKWQQCTRDEKLLLFQIATGSHVNPANIEVLEHLVRRGFLYREAGWHLINFSFRRFVLSAENEQQMADWMADANQGIWQFIRVPIMVVALVLVVLILLGTGEGLESVLAILSAMLGLIPLLLRNFGSFGTQQTISTE